MSLLATIGILLCATCAGYAAVATWLVARRSPSEATSRALVPVTVLKPLCGDEPGLEDNLRSYFEQDHPAFQLVFGVHEPSDPALAVVRALQARYPQVDCSVVIDGRLYGSNLKVCNLINMVEHAKHDLFVISDSDISVAPGHLRRLLPPLDDPKVGLVTCLYRGIPRGGFWSRVGALFIDEWFAPSVRVAQALGSQEFCFGATVALRRETLRRVGGLAALANQLADDYWLGALVREHGLESRLSAELVGTDVTESRLGDLARHELCWLRTIRMIRPWGYVGSFITLGWPVVAAGVALSHGAPLAWALLVSCLAVRVALHYTFRLSARITPTIDVLPLLVRDPLTVALWGYSFVSRRIRWRHIQFVVAPDGSLRETI